MRAQAATFLPLVAWHAGCCRGRTMLHPGPLDLLVPASSGAAASSVAPSTQRRGVGRAGNRACGHALRVTLVLDGSDVITQLTVDAVGSAAALNAEGARAALLGR